MNRVEDLVRRLHDEFAGPCPNLYTEDCPKMQRIRAMVRAVLELAAEVADQQEIDAFGETGHERQYIGNAIRALAQEVKP